MLYVHSCVYVFLKVLSDCIVSRRNGRDEGIETFDKGGGGRVAKIYGNDDRKRIVVQRPARN